MYFFLLMLYKTSTCKIFWLCAVVGFFHNFYSLKTFYFYLQWKTQCLFTYIRSGSVSHYFPVGSEKFSFSRTGFVYVKNWKNSENSSISQLCFLSGIYLRFIIALVKGMFDLLIDKKNKNKMSSMNKSFVSIVPKKLSNCLKRAETSVVFIVFDCVLCEVRAYKFTSL
jgi:hypothetical protein